MAEQEGEKEKKSEENLPTPAAAPAPPAPAAPAELETVAVGKKNLMSIFLQPTDEERAAGKTAHVVELTPQESLVLRTFLKTKNHESTAAAIGIQKDSVRRILARPNIRRFLDELRDRAAIASNTDLEFVAKELRMTYEGIRKPTDQQYDALKTLGKIFTPKTGVVVNIQNNNAYSSEGAALDAEWESANKSAE